MDLWNQLKKEEGADQITPHWRSKQVIASALDDYTCSSPAKAKSLFEHMSNSSSSKLAKQLRSSIEHTTSDDEYPEVSINMAERDTGKQLAFELENSATPGMYMGTRSRSRPYDPSTTELWYKNWTSPKNSL